MSLYIAVILRDIHLWLKNNKFIKSFATLDKENLHKDLINV
jgi:hypothetical protein